MEKIIKEINGIKLIEKEGQVFIKINEYYFIYLFKNLNDDLKLINEFLDLLIKKYDDILLLKKLKIHQNFTDQFDIYGYVLFDEIENKYYLFNPKTFVLQRSSIEQYNQNIYFFIKKYY